MKNEQRGFAFWEFLILWGGLLALSGIVGGFCWPYGINSWLVYLDKPPALGFWGGFLLGCLPVAGQCSIPLALITWVLMLFLV